MRGLLYVLGLLALFAAPRADAAEFEGCDKAQIAFASAAVDGAAMLAWQAAAAVSDTPEYRRWFGAFSPTRAEVLRRNLKAVHRALRDETLVLVCPTAGEDGCAFDTYANVWPDQPYRVNLCAAFFGQPTMAGVVTASRAFESGTREGTIIHEVSHFTAVADTEDHCYDRGPCEEMAKTAPDLAVHNADSLQYFSEDVILARQGRLPED